MMRNVLEWLEASARRVPDAIAFEDERSGVAYQALHTRAREIGTFVLGRVAAQSPVLIMMEKGPLAIAAMLGAVYAGCFYTPVDPDMPIERIKLIVSALEARCILCEEKHLALARLTQSETPVYAVESIPNEMDDAALARVRDDMIDTDLLYVLFTSGSTGVPKGVAIAHHSVIDFIDWSSDTLGLGQDCRFGNQAPLYFDNSVFDIYNAIKLGACVHFIPRKFFTFPGRLTRYLAEKRINTIFWVPSALTAVANAGALEKSDLDDLRRVFFCGEVMPCRTLNAWRQRLPDALYVNMYGPTEITDVCAYYVVDRDFQDDDVLPIGKACRNTRIVLLNGEIAVSGACLSKGYYNAPERTQEVFIQNPMRRGIREIVYKTGDLGSYNERHELMFGGRKDSQIKRQGYRIELGEIESCLNSLPGIGAACCLYDEGQTKIVCFYTGGLEPRDIKKKLSIQLPKYMLPDVFIQKHALPETGNGKLDRVSLRQEWEHEHPVH